jgi:cellulose biosynthesis protein BcsQ
MSAPETPGVVAFVGATGGAGTTRTVAEVAAALAADGRTVAVVDAAFGTQGLSDYLTGRLDPDVTALVTDEEEAALSAGLYDLDVGPDVAGRVAVCPAHAPFERLARAKRVDAVQALESRIATAASRFDHVLLDVPPIAANQAVAAVNAATHVTVVAPASDRGATAIQRTHERLTDVGSEASLVVSTRGELETADVSIPDAGSLDVQNVPRAANEDSAFTAAVERVAAAVTGREITGVDTEQDGFFGTVGEYVSR